jgi:hypothetical protein
MTYTLNQEAKAFSYTREELFECITKIVAHPHKTITEHDHSRALAIMVVFEDYLANFTHRDGDGEYYIPECDELDFLDFVRFKLCIDDYDYVSVDDILK